MREKVANKPVPKRDTDNEVQRMLKTWDIVKCFYCGRDISLLNAISIKNGQYFVCKEQPCQK
jgi:hypothetical protein